MMRACMLVLVLFAGACAPPATARPVTTADATVRADLAATLRPGQSVTIGGACGAGYGFTETSAYQRTGAALGDEQRTRSGLSYWRGAHGRVTYDRASVTFTNGTWRSVIVAGWCS